MKKILFSVVLALSAVTAFSQTTTIRTAPVVPTVGAPNYNKGVVQDANLKVLLTFGIPYGPSFTLNNANGESGKLFYNTTTNKLGVFNGSAWDVVGAGGSGSVTSVTATDKSGQTWTITNPGTTPNIELTLTKVAVGLGNVDNTSDANKPISTATQTALDSRLTQLQGDARYGQLGSANTWTAINTYGTGSNTAQVSAFGFGVFSTGFTTYMNSTSFSFYQGGNSLFLNAGALSSSRTATFPNADITVAGIQSGLGASTVNAPDVTTVNTALALKQTIANKYDGDIYDTGVTTTTYPNTFIVQQALNGKQNLVTLTTTGIGAPSFNQATGALNIPTPSASVTNLSLGTATSTTQPVLNSNGTGFTLPSATTSLAGLQSASDKTKLDGIATGATANTGTVTSVSVTTANGVSGSVANSTTTPAITLTLGAITPTSVTSSGLIIANSFQSSSSTASVITGTGTDAAFKAQATGTGAIASFLKNGTSVAQFDNLGNLTATNFSGSHSGTSSGTNTGDNATNTTSNAYADAGLATKANTNGSNATGTWPIDITGYSNGVLGTTGHGFKVRFETDGKAKFIYDVTELAAWPIDISGSAPLLTTARNIQGVAFNGSADINIINGTGLVRATGTTLSYDNNTYATQAYADAKVQNSLTASTTIAPSATAVNTALALKANLASPALTGIPTAPTAVVATNTTQLATTAHVKLVVASGQTIGASTTGSAATLTTSRLINGVAFNGSTNITVTADAGTLTGTTLASGVTNSSLISLGTVTTGTWNAGSVTATASIAPLFVTSTSASLLASVYTYNTSTLLGYIGNGLALFTAGSTSQFGMRSENGLVFGTGDNIRYTIDASGNNTWSGSGTFAGQVTAPSFKATNFLEGNIPFMSSTGVIVTDAEVGPNWSSNTLFVPNKVYLSNISTPGTPASGGYFYTKSGALYYKGSAGTETLIANP